MYPSNKTVTVATGERVELAVEFCSNPPYNKAFWMAEGRIFTPGLTTPDGILAHKITVSTSDNFYAFLRFFPFEKPWDNPLNTEGVGVKFECFYFILQSI